MKVLSAISSPAQDDVIEKILRARGERDPPWTRERRARSPPRQLEMFSTVLDEEYSQVRPESEEEFNEDPSGSDFVYTAAHAERARGLGSLVVRRSRGSGAETRRELLAQALVQDGLGARVLISDPRV